MKNKIALIFCLIICFGNLSAQKVTSRYFTAGKNFLNNTDIQGIEYEFSDAIYKFLVDTNNNFLTVQLEEDDERIWSGKFTKKIIQYDLNNNKTLWSKEGKNRTLNLLQTDNLLIIANSKQSTFINPNTGKENFTVKNQIKFIANNNLGIGYSTNLYNINYCLEGINLENGKSLWKTKNIKHDFGWNEVLHLSDTTLLIASDGLHSINLKNGQGYHFPSATGKKNYKSKTLGNIASGLGLILFGYGYFYVGENLLSEVVSNVFKDIEFTYFASSTNIVKFDKSVSNILWTKKLPKNEVSKSTIIEKNDLIIMINHGFALFDNKIIPYGKPFIAAFYKETGIEKYFQYIEKEPIISFYTLNNEIYLITEQKISSFSTQTGKLITEKSFPKEKFSNLRIFVDKQVFFTNDDNHFLELKQSDTTKLYVFTAKNILILDENLNVEETKNYEDLYVFYAKIGKNKLIGNSHTTFIINETNDKIGKFDAHFNSVVYGNNLFIKNNTKIKVIDISNFK